MNGKLILNLDNPIDGEANVDVAEKKQMLRPLVVLGSSVSEQFDYIFGNNPNYHPFWASGWTARSLRARRSDKYLAQIMGPIPKNTNVFLSFGSMDVNFVAQRIANARGHYDFNGFLKDSSDGIIHARATLLKLGFKNVKAVFVAPVVDLPNTYWEGHSMDYQLPTAMRASMNYDLAQVVGRQIPTVNLLDDLIVSPVNPIASPDLVRSEFEHHLNYIAAQNIVWRGIKNIEGMLERRQNQHDTIYPHTTHWIKDLRKNGITRPRSCN